MLRLCPHHDKQCLNNLPCDILLTLMRQHVDNPGKTTSQTQSVFAPEQLAVGSWNRHLVFLEFLSS